jgi:DNA-binding response OmpR family regulator
LKNNILLVDDDEALLETYKTMLEIDGYKVYDAISPYKALQIIKQQDIQLAILDYNLPQMNGAQLGHLIKKAKDSTMIMFISGNPEINELVKYVDYRVFSVLKKPFELSLLTQTVNNIVDKTGIEVISSNHVPSIQMKISKMVDLINWNLSGFTKMPTTKI